MGNKLGYKKVNKQANKQIDKKANIQGNKQSNKLNKTFVNSLDNTMSNKQGDKQDSIQDNKNQLQIKSNQGQSSLSLSSIKTFKFTLRHDKLKQIQQNLELITFLKKQKLENLKMWEYKQLIIQFQHLPISQVVLLFQSLVEVKHHYFVLKNFRNELILPQKENNSFQSTQDHTLKLMKLCCCPKFINLEILRLESCSISNVQALSFIQAPQLKSVMLPKNHITGLKPFAKFNHQGIYPFLSGNPIDKMINETRMILLGQSYKYGFLSSSFGYIYKKSSNRHYPTELNQIISSLKIRFRKVQLLKLSR